MHDPSTPDPDGDGDQAPLDPAQDSHLVLVDGEEVELRVKGSRFRGQALSAADETEAAERLDAIRKRYHDATHHCWAAWHGPPGATVEHCDDDGEPRGTAGPPLLHPLVGSGRHDGLVVVTRWFGGTKLGKGGLVQAYGECARMALDAASSRRVWRERKIECRVGYDDVGTVEAVLAREDDVLRGVDRPFHPDPHYVILVRRSAADRVAAQLVEATAGRARIEVEPA